MGLCTLCQTIDFEHLPSLPSHYEGYTKPWDGLLSFMSLRLNNARKADESENAGEFSQPLGIPHHQSIDELKNAADDCPICSIIERAVRQTLTAIAEAEQDEVFVYYNKQERLPDFRLWLTRRRDKCDGFMVVSSRNPVYVCLLAAVGFCVEDADPLSVYLKGRVIDEDPLSILTLHRTLNWVHECNNEHTTTRCSSVADVKKLPLRVLDLECDTARSRIRLYETNGALGKYTALSHVWGNHRHFTTTQANIPGLKKGITLDVLPRTFQDAVFLTRKLGIQYLWIDSLCICQDDGPDWERESAKMASIYANAYITIAASAAKDDSEGLFSQRSRPNYVSFEYTRNNGLSGKVYAFLIPLEEAAWPGTICEQDKEPLSSRGWTLQERFLASRVLHVGAKQLYFECYSHFLSEDGFRIQGRFNSVHEDSHPSQVKADGSGSELLQNSNFRGPWLWYSILSKYYSRKLTKESDKLPALSGIAQTFEEKTGDKYVAGLWRSTLVEGLLWQALGTRRRATSAPLQYRAPSWSWASIDGPFANIGLVSNEPFDRSSWIDISTILDCQVELKGKNPYGEVKSGWIKIRAPIEPLSPSQEKEVDWETVPHERALRMKTRAGKPYGTYCMFDTLDDETAAQMPLCALILTRGDKENPSYQALIITPTEGKPDQYRRVGKMIMDNEVLGVCDWMNGEAELATIVLV
ncbi:HET-domain-containing protein [Lindgomyces ingoldianus]|uniref:HET-domain-containing protein n=1 Tax=Lindgomyces ingoldianus TaxID=673940 RepID=A0ACB6R525_9PLEO|nr:HET-domain-containing protein [Lindgomyces ingoldianus]KAF2473392.1 HET-domain-containing protein [Lindgomyces ingoldianus]